MINNDKPCDSFAECRQENRDKFYGYTVENRRAELRYQSLFKKYVIHLVNIRQNYKDALIYGSQLYQPKTGDPAVAAYFFRGKHHDLITVVNTSMEKAYSGLLNLEDMEATSRWRDLPTGEVLEASGGRLVLEIPPKELRILLLETTVSK